MVSLFGALFGITGLGLISAGIVNLRKWQTMRNMDPGGATAIGEDSKKRRGALVRSTTLSRRRSPAPSRWSVSPKSSDTTIAANT